MSGDLVIGIDSSTTATKAIAWDAKGRAIAEGRAAIALSNPRPGWFEQDADDWWGAAKASLRQLTGSIDASRVAALAVANQRESFCQFAHDGTALRPGTLWLDERACAEVKQLSNEIGAERIHAISGKPPDVVPCLYRCAWFRTHMPQMWRDMAITSEVHGFLGYRFTGAWVTSTASADPMGLLDVERRDWSDELLETVGLDRSRVPKLFPPGEGMGELTGEAASETGLPSGLPVIAGGGDGQCAGTGANVFEPACAYINLGTAVVSGNFGLDYRLGRAFRTMTAVAERGYLYESAIRSGAFLINWMAQEMFGIAPEDAHRMLKALSVEAEAVPIGADGIIVLPYWSGSMTPYWDSSARGVIAGLSSSHKRGQVYRALLEGVALEQTLITDQIAAATRPIERFIAIGGGAASDLWCQILADCSGREVLRSTTVEASALGAGIAAAKGAGWFASFGEAARAMAGRTARTFAPEPRAHESYRRLLPIYRDLWPAIARWNERITAFAAGAQDG